MRQKMGDDKKEQREKGEHKDTERVKKLYIGEENKRGRKEKKKQKRPKRYNRKEI